MGLNPDDFTNPARGAGGGTYRTSIISNNTRWEQYCSQKLGMFHKCLYENFRDIRLRCSLNDLCKSAHPQGLFVDIEYFPPSRLSTLDTRAGQGRNVQSHILAWSIFRLLVTIAHSIRSKSLLVLRYRFSPPHVPVSIVGLLLVTLAVRKSWLCSLIPIQVNVDFSLESSYYQSTPVRTLAMRKPR